MMVQPNATTVLPFGRHRGQPLGTVPTSYLTWLAATVKLSTGLRNAVAAELTRRGLPVPTPPTPAEKPLPPCGRCGSTTSPRLTWHETRSGTRQIRRECSRCGTWLGAAPQTPANVAEADRSATPAPILDALLLAAAEDVELVSDGRVVRLGRGWERASADLRDAVRQRGRLLASLVGRRKVLP